MGDLANKPAVQGSFHPIDSADAAHPERLAEVRARCPVSVAARDGYPSVTMVATYEGIAEVFRNWRAFGSIGADPDPDVHDATPMELRPIIALDPPAHTWARRLNNLAMAPAAVEKALPYVASQAAALVGAFADDRQAELVGEWAEPLPGLAIARVLGLPEEDSGFIHDWVVSQFTESAAAAAGSNYGRTELPADEAFQGYLLEQIALRREDTAPEDAMTDMIRYRRDDGSSFSDLEISVHIRVLLIAGNETTTSLMSNLMYRLLSEPGLYERVAADRALVVPAIEESLRLDTPLQVIIRRANEDATVGDVLVERGSVIALSTMSGNRDETVWGEDADRYRLDRFAGDVERMHLGFGLGVHHCVGSFLARQTTALAVNALFDAIPSMSLEPGYEYENVFFHVFHRPKRLPVVFG